MRRIGSTRCASFRRGHLECHRDPPGTLPRIQTTVPSSRTSLERAIRRLTGKCGRILHLGMDTKGETVSCHSAEVAACRITMAWRIKTHSPDVAPRMSWSLCRGWPNSRGGFPKIEICGCWGVATTSPRCGRSTLPKRGYRPLPSSALKTRRNLSEFREFPSGWRGSTTTSRFRTTLSCPARTLCTQRAGKGPGRLVPSLPRRSMHEISRGFVVQKGPNI